MAKHHNDLQVRCDMVHFIDDEDILKDIFLNDDVARVCICAMSQIKDTDFLTDECLNNPNSHLRLAILNRIFDESLLSENELSQLLEKILLNDPNSYVLKTALEKAKSVNHDVLVKILKANDDEVIIKEALKKLADEKLLADFALNHPTAHIRLAAIQNPNLRDINTIYKIIVCDENELNRMIATGKIEDADSLVKIIYKPDSYPFLGEISRNILIPLNDYFLNHFNETGCYIDVLFIEDGDFLDKLVLNENDAKIKAFAIKNKNFRNDKILENLIKNESSPEILLEVVSKIKNDELLRQYIENHLKYEDVTVKAVSQINDLKFLEKLSEDNDSRIRFEAVKRISDMKNTDDLLHKIALTEPDETIAATAVEAIDSRNNLIDIADFRCEKNIRAAALKKIKTKRLLKNYLYCIQKSIHDVPFERVLRDIALNDDDLEIRKIATSKLNDKDVLDKIIAKNDETSQIAQKRVNTLFDDIKFLNSITVLEKLIDSGDSDISKVANITLEDLKTWESRISQINEIDEINSLKDIALNDFNYFVRSEAEGRLEKLLFNVRLNEVGTKENQDKFRAIYLDESFPYEIRKKALLKIKDKDFLKDN